jgi:uncharacterized protein
VPPRGPSRPSHPNPLPALAIFARAPVPHRAKTRLIPLLGPRGAAEFHAALVSDVLQKVNGMASRVAPYFFLAGGRFPVSSSLSEYTLVRQRGHDLGERLERAFRNLLARHGRALVIGTDSPLLQERDLIRGLQRLRHSDAVLGPCPDGGFYLIGLRRLERGLFDRVRWGGDFAFGDVLGNLRARGFSCAVLHPLDDVDRPADVARLGKTLAANRAARKRAPCAWRFLRDFVVLEKAAEKGELKDGRTPPPA